MLAVVVLSVSSLVPSTGGASSGSQSHPSPPQGSASGSVVTPSVSGHAAPSGPSSVASIAGFPGDVGEHPVDSQGPLLGRQFDSSNNSGVLPPHPGVLPAASPPFVGHYYTGSIYNGPNRTASDLRVVIQVPDDVPQVGPGNFYYVLLSVWDNAGSYDQIGFADAFGAWGIAYSTTSYCGGSYYYSPEAFVLQRGVSYAFEMTISSGTVRFSVTNAQDGQVVWVFAAVTGGSHFLEQSLFSCNSQWFYDYTDYEEVYYTSGKTVPYDLFFSNNTADGTPVTSWGITGSRVHPSGANIALANEPYYLTFSGGSDVTNLTSTTATESFSSNISIAVLSPDTSVNFSTYMFPNGWNVTFSPSSGTPPFLTQVNVTIPAGTSAGSYIIGINTTDHSPGNWSRLALRVNVGPEYVVTFSQSGLPPGMPFSVALGDGVNSSSGALVQFRVPNGTYPFWIADASGYHQTSVPYRGNVTINGSGTSEPIAVFSIVTYSIRFAESGLSRGLSWQVTFNGTTKTTLTDGGTDNLTFVGPNGTYLYSIGSVPGWGESTLPTAGSLAVHGSNVTETTASYRQVYPVTFQEAGLPAGAAWNVSVNGLSEVRTTDGGTDNLTFLEPNGTFSFSVPSVPGWKQSTVAASGNLTVAGVALVEPTLLYQELFTVIFTESGLPAGITWQVTLNGTTRSISTDGATDSLTFSETNGSFGYSIAGLSGWRQSTLSGVGTVSVQGSRVSEPTLLYFSVVYVVTFSEAGLPSGLTWQITVGGTPKSLITDGGLDSLTWTEPNGTYSYTFGVLPGWSQRTLVSGGSLTVVGASVSEPTMQYGVTTYSTIFSEKGLPSGTWWGIKIGISTDSTTGTLLYYAFPNGTYSFTVVKVPNYSVSPGSGTFTIAGAAVTISIRYSQPTYNVTIAESGLPTGQGWACLLFAIQPYNPYGNNTGSTQSSLAFTGNYNGTYQFIIESPKGYTVNPMSGDFTVHGANVTIPVVFSAGLGVSFAEQGLPNGATWNVTLGGVTRSSNGPWIDLGAANGTYTYQIGAVPGFRAAPPSGTVVVNGSSPSLGVQFSPVLYNITFVEQGLPAGTSWTIYIGPYFCAAVGVSVQCPMPNGTFAFSIAGVPGYVATPSGGTVTVAGAPLTVTIGFSPPHYQVVFQESGLAPATNWTVTLGPNASTTSTTSVTFTELNGTFAYSVTPVPGYTVAPRSGNVTVQGNFVMVFIRFSPIVFRAAFVESGLPSGATWSISFDGTVRNASGPSVSYSVPNGSYPFLIRGPRGYVTAVPSGLLEVTGANASVTVDFTRGSTATLRFHETGLAVGSRWCVTVSASKFCASSANLVLKNMTPSTYRYTIASIPSLTTLLKVGASWEAASGGNLTLGPLGATAAVRFGYTVKLIETGLSGAFIWSVSAQGETVSSSNNTILLFLTNGTHAFVVHPVSGYAARPHYGYLTVWGVGVSRSIIFSLT